MNFKNSTNVSAADSVARRASIYMRLRAKLGDRREREAEAVANVRLNFRRGKKVPISSRSPSSGCAATGHIACGNSHQSEILDGIVGHKSASRVGANYGESAAGKKAVIRSEA